MFRSALLAGVVCCVMAGSLRADFTYEETTKITGGMMAGMMKVAGVFSKTAREPIVSTIMVSGDRMARVSSQRVSIIDLNAETITDVDLQKKTYSVLTFAEMTQALQRMNEKMQQQKNEKGEKADVNFKASIKDTGQSKVINGFNANEAVGSKRVDGRYVRHVAHTLGARLRRSPQLP